MCALGAERYSERSVCSSSALACDKQVGVSGHGTYRAERFLLLRQDFRPALPIPPPRQNHRTANSLRPDVCARAHGLPYPYAHTKNVTLHGEAGKSGAPDARVGGMSVRAGQLGPFGRSNERSGLVRWVRGG